MNPNILQHFIKKHFTDIYNHGFIAIKELNDADNIGQIPKKDINHYKNWQDVPFEYLNQYFTGISQLNPKGFLFYTPAIIYQVLADFDERNHCASVVWWLYELDKEILGDKFLENLSLFNEEQLFLLVIFLQKLMPSGIMDKQKFIKIITAIEYLILNNPKEIP